MENMDFPLSREILTFPFDESDFGMKTKSMLMELDIFPTIIDVRTRPISIHAMVCNLPIFVMGVRSPYL